MKWRVIISGKSDPYFNMALDEAIYENVVQEQSPPTIRFYDWQPASFSCGFNQDIEKELDFEILKQSVYAFVRRPTGGRMVLHEDEVTYSVISPLEGRMAGSISDTYLRIGNALLKGLQLLQVDAELSRSSLSPNEQKKAANPCFTSSSRHELTYKRKKLVGSAQTRNHKAFLQHGSILKTHNQKRVADFIPNISDDERLRIASLLERRTISLQSILNRPISFDEVVGSLLTGFKDAWSDEVFSIEENPSDEEIRRAQKLVYDKYSTDNWNKKQPKKGKKNLTYI